MPRRHHDPAPPPGKPTKVDITPGLDTLTITWQPNGPAATGWQIRYSHTVHHTLPYPRDEIIEQTHDVTTAAVPPGGATITDLKYSTVYTIEIRGHNNNDDYGDWSDPESATTPPPAAVELVALEITQGLQNWQGDITLVKGKQTVLRVFLEPTGVDPTPVHVRLTALRGGQTLEGSTHTVNGVSPPAPPETVPPPGVYFVATGDVIAQRGDLGVSLNFLLPASSSEWVGSTQGARNDFDITYRIEVAEGVICVGALAHGSGCAQTVTFKHIDPASIVVVPLTYNNVTPTDAMIEEQRRRIESLMPIPSLTAHVHTKVLRVTSGLSSSGLIKVIDAESDDDAVVYVGIMRDTGTSSDYRGGTLVDLKTAWWNIRGHGV